jgi:hypothetical protein
MELLAIWQGEFYLVCFCFGWELREMVGGIYRRVGVARVRSGSDGAGDTRQQTRQGEGDGVASGDGGGGCAAKGAWGSGSAHGGGHE